MKHITLDCYGGMQHLLNNMTTIYQLLNEVGYRFDLDPIAPPHIIPYYYGRVKEDSGITAYVLLRGGHITIHTFPFRECYFVDIFMPKDFDEKEVYDYFFDTLPFDKKSSNMEVIDRTHNTFDILPYSADIDFGPHLMSTIETKEDLTMDKMFDFLERIVKDINMDPIIRAVTIKDQIDHPKYLSGIIIIAQSHIAVHYDIDKKRAFADIFSCAPFDYQEVGEIITRLGILKSNSLVARGTKHIYKVKSSITDSEFKSSTLWQKNIGINK